MRMRYLATIVLYGLSWAALADDNNQTRNAAIGGGLGGAAGGAIGSELGGREGAIIGAGLGAAVGTAIGTRDTGSEPKHRSPTSNAAASSAYYAPAQRGTFCPPGQAKKGRC